jgi:cytoskeleton protein RodZ
MQTGALTPDNATPGRTLAAARTERGLSVSEVAQRLKFSVRHIEALEADHYDALPGGPYVRGMVRTYAKLLSVDAARLLDALPQSDAGREPAMEPRHMSVPFPQESGPSSRVYLLLSMLIIVAVVVVLAEWFIRSQRSEESGLPPVATAPEAKAERAAHPDEPVPPGGGAGETSPQAPSAAEPSQPAPESNPEPLAGTAPQAPPAAASPAGESVPVAGGTVPSQASPTPMDGRPSAPPTPLKPGQARLTFNFDLESWVEVKDANGDVVFSALNQPGTEKSIVGTPPLSLVIGNASGVRLTYKGEPVTLKPSRTSDVARFTLE